MRTLQKTGIIVGSMFIAGATVLSIAYGFTVGNAIAFCIGSALIAFGVWFQKLSRPWRRFVVISTSIGVCCFLFITGYIIAYGCRDTVTFDEDCVLVLGCGIRGETLLPTLQARLDKCLEYHAQNPQAPIVVSGGQGPKEDIAEAEAMKRYLIQNGVSETQIIVEDQSRNTKENFLLSKQLLDDRFPGKNYAMACITSDYHALRTQRIAREAGLDIRLFNAGVKWYLRPSAYCREALSICKHRIFG